MDYGVLSSEKNEVSGTWPACEKDFAIREIVEKGVVKPGDQFGKVLEAGRICTLHTLFFGVGDCFLSDFLIAACIWLLLIQAGSQVMICMVFAV